MSSGESMVLYKYFLWFNDKVVGKFLKGIFCKGVPKSKSKYNSGQSALVAEPKSVQVVMVNSYVKPPKCM